MGFGEELRARREALGLSTTAAAQRYGVAQGTWSLWENGRRTPDEARQAAILASLTVPASPQRGDYRDGALWALSLMHEALSRAYRELAERGAAERDDAAADDDVSPPATAGPARSSRRPPRAGAPPDPR